MSNRLYRSSTDKFIGGVCGGLADHYRIDPSIVRVLAVLLTLGTGIGLVLYIAMWIVVPLRPYGEAASTTGGRTTGWNSYLPGVLLIGAGAILMIVQVFRWLHWYVVWPVLLILVGLGLVFYQSGRSSKDHFVNMTGRDGQ
jgi:phage shock protein PspC (stress-responsive transcriptional regulator)